MKNEEDEFENVILPHRIALGALMIIGTFLPYLTYWGEEARLLGTKYGTIVIIGGIITIISGLFWSRIRAGFIVGGIVSLVGMYGADAYYSEMLKEYIDLASLINKEIGYYVILLSSVALIIDGVASLIKCWFESLFER
jgi:hypothetical protein